MAYSFFDKVRVVLDEIGEQNVRSERAAAEDLYASIWTRDILPATLDEAKAVEAINDCLAIAGASARVTEYEVVVGPIAAKKRAREHGADSSSIMSVGTAYFEDIAALMIFVKDEPQIQKHVSAVLKTIESGLFACVLLEEVGNSDNLLALLIPNPVMPDGRVGMYLQRRGDRYILHNPDGAAIRFRYNGQSENMFYVLNEEADQHIIRHIMYKRGVEGGVKFPKAKFTESNDSDYKGRVLQVVGDDELVDYLDMEVIQEKVFEHPFLDPNEYDLEDPSKKNPRYMKEKYLDKYQLLRTREQVEAYGEHVVMIRGWDPAKMAPVMLTVPPDTKDIEKALLDMWELPKFGITKYAATFVS